MPSTERGPERGPGREKTFPDCQGRVARPSGLFSQSETEGAPPLAF